MIRTPDVETHEQLQQLFNALGNPTRFRIFQMLMTGAQCNCELADELNIPINLISHHVHLLIDMGFVTARRNETDARWIHFSIDRAKLEDVRRSFLELTDPSSIQDRAPNCPVLQEN